MSKKRTDWGDRVVRYPPEDVERYRNAGLWGNRTIAQEFREVARANADRPALVTPDARFTYRELDERTDLIAAGLLDLGLEPGGRVVFQVGNTAQTVLGWYGVLKAGLIPVCALEQHRHREIDEIARRTEATAHLVQADLQRFDLVAFAREVAERQPTMGHLITIGSTDAAGSADRLEDLGAGGDPRATRRRVEEVQAAIDPDEVAVLQLSGGTTSVPKAIPRLHAEYWYNARAYADFWGWGPDDRPVHLLPVIHNAGIVCGLHAAHSVGACFVLGTHDPRVYVPLVAAEEATDTLILLHFVVALAEDAQMRHAFRSIKRLNFSGTKLPESIAATLTGAGLHIVQMFGMGEGLFLMTPADAPAALRHHTVGVPISPLDEVRIYEPGTETETPAGWAGELCCRGPYTIRGYYDAPERNREAFTEDGFYRTGDVARAREIDGITCYSIEGRIKDLINRGGEKVNAEEVELALVKHPSVREVAVVAMPDPRLGERTCAYIALRSGADVPTLEAVKRFLQEEGLAKYKWPERIEVVDVLPRTPVGKLNKEAMRQDVAAKL